MVVVVRPTCKFLYSSEATEKRWLIGKKIRGCNINVAPREPDQQIKNSTLAKALLPWSMKVVLKNFGGVM